MFFPFCCLIFYFFYEGYSLNQKVETKVVALGQIQGWKQIPSLPSP